MYFYIKLVRSFTLKIHWGRNKTTSKSNHENCGDTVRCCTCFWWYSEFYCSQKLPGTVKAWDVTIFCLLLDPVELNKWRKTWASKKLHNFELFGICWFWLRFYKDSLFSAVFVLDTRLFVWRNPCSRVESINFTKARSSETEQTF